MNEPKINLLFDVIMKTRVNHFSNYMENTTDIRKEEDDILIYFGKIFSSFVTDSFYILDIQQKQFCYIKPDNLFLCDHSIEDAMKLKYDFYSRIIHPEDLPLWESILRSIFQYIKDEEEKREEIDYFSCTFRLLHKCSFISHPLSQMVYHRMKPIWKEDELRYLICSMEHSCIKKVGNLYLHSTRRLIYKEYSFVARRWKQYMLEPLTERERLILMLARQGKSTVEIADELYKGVNTIRNQIKVLFAKLEVHSMQEAIEIACCRGML